MKITRLFAVLFLLLFSCQTTMKAPQGSSELYQKGYEDGAMSARLVSGDTTYTYKKDTDNYSDNSGYAKGWKDGFNKNIIQGSNNEIIQKALDLAQFTSEEQKIELKAYFRWKKNKAFALNRTTNSKYSWGYGYESIERAKKEALSRCGNGCELFAVNDKIVWPYQTKEISTNTQSSVTTTSQSATQKPESVTFQYHNYQQQPINKLQTNQQPASTQQTDSQTPSQQKPAEPKNQPTAQLTQAAQQIQQPQPIQQHQQQTTVYAKPQLADRRIALVIGNEKYINAPLENPVNDSRAVGNVLKRLGFKTLQYENLGQKEMKRAIDDFGTQLKNYDVGLFFYSGHGTQIKGENYLIPIDAAPKSENEVDYDCLPAGRVLAKMEDSGSVTNIIILDACRNNPFERSWSRSSQSKGLVFMSAPSGSLIAYATSPGKIAFDKSSQKNSPYTSALLKHIETPNISIVQMFQRVRVTVEDETGKEQTPWESTSLRDDFYFYRVNGQ